MNLQDRIIQQIEKENAKIRLTNIALEQEVLKLKEENKILKKDAWDHTLRIAELTTETVAACSLIKDYENEISSLRSEVTLNKIINQ